MINEYKMLPETYGALRSPPDPSDNIYENLTFGSNSSSTEDSTHVDLRKWTLPSRDQSTRGTCAAFAGATISEITRASTEGTMEYMSPEFLYYHRDNKPAEGMYGRNVFKILQTIGIAPENVFEYGSKDQPSIEAYEQADNNKVTFYARVLTCAGLRRAVREIGPCYIVLPLYSHRPEFWRAQSGEKTAALGHSLVVIGFDDTAFLLKNSWGPEWNGDGCVRFPFVDFHLVWECWVSISRKVKVRSRDSRVSGSEKREKHRSDPVRRGGEPVSIRRGQSEAALNRRPVSCVLF